MNQNSTNKSTNSTNTNTSRKRAANVSDRERRMRKRQSLDSDVIASDLSSEQGKNKGQPAEPRRPTKKGKMDVGNTLVEQVIKMKLNTGMLYIYRGTRPRVEFIRRY